ncbi:MarR family winged helix-turn-helix transcriptional regulator [Stappia indica]|uniref:MarR family winged helix-turn-helix transcriptional regulator n=1 Tax=Stappia indica TaxID=538381 RepID=UPI001CD7DCE4|nr:MarR family transcriptional regulator [Stappia indica]MCA1300442.1 MarR family transcriptional regulator [Stappia indica]
MKQDIDTSAALRAQLMNRLAFRLYQCANLLNKTGTKALEAHDVTTQQWAIIGALVRERWAEGIAVHQLASLLMVSRQNLTGVLSRMEDRGLIERKKSKVDSRSRLIRLTPDGWKRWEEMQADIAGFYDGAMKDLSNNDLIHALHYLDRMRENMHDVDNTQGG